MEVKNERGKVEKRKTENVRNEDVLRLDRNNLKHVQGTV